jgi:hypothetical protein
VSAAWHWETNNIKIAFFSEMTNNEVLISSASDHEND